MADLTFWISVAVLAAILTLPIHREEIRNEFDSASPVQVAMKVCHARADVGGGEFVPCMRQAVPGLAWSSMPGRQ